MAKGKVNKKPTPVIGAVGPSMAAYARISVNLSVEQAAKLARICPAYLRQVERRSCAPYVLAIRLSHIYGCPLSAFLHFDLGKERPK